MWVMASEPLYDEKAEVWYVSINLSNHEDRKNADEIFWFDTEEEALTFDFNQHFNDNFEDYFGKRQKAEKLQNKKN